MHERWPFVHFGVGLSLLKSLILLGLLPLFVAEHGDPQRYQQHDASEARLVDHRCNERYHVRSFAEEPKDLFRYPVCSRALSSREDHFASDEAGSMAVTVGQGSKTSESQAVSGDETAKSEEASETDTESPLDNDKFLSFEEWKKKNLAKAGQSADNVRGNGSGSVATDKRKRQRPGDVSNSLDSLGEDGEIELGFGGLEDGGSNVHSSRVDSTDTGDNRDDNHATRDTEGESPSDSVPRRGLSRGKFAGTTCKERFNYASFDCAATVLKSNRECTGSSSILIENKDSYMLNECRAKDKFIILELCDDILIDTIVLANYEFFSSIFRTFRVSVADRYPAKPDKWKELGTYEAANTREIQAFAIENPLIWTRYVRIEFLSHYGKEFYCPVSLVRVHGTTMMEEYKIYGDSVKGEEEVADTVVQSQEPQTTLSDKEDVNQTHATRNATISRPGSRPLPDEQALGASCFPEIDEIEKLLLGINSDNMSSIYDMIADANQPLHTAELADEQPIPTTSVKSGGSENPSRTNSPSYTNGASESERQVSESHTASASGLPKEENGTLVEKPTIASQPPQPHPTTQESFFKSVHKRLQMLEANSTLSLLYIEEQSRILRDAFNKVEKRQLAKTSSFLENLNSTVLHELREFRQQYDHIWHSVVGEFELQRQQYHHELFAVTNQLAVMAEEVVFQKRVSIIQSVFVLLCFGVVLFSRSAVGSYLEFPKSMVSRAHSFRSSSPSYETPAASPNITHDKILYHKEHIRRRNTSDSHSSSELGHGNSMYSSPLPSPSEEENKSLQEVQSEYAQSTVNNSLMPDEKSNIIKRQRSSPAELGGGDADDSFQSAPQS